MIYADLAAHGEGRRQVVAMLKQDLAGKLPLQARVKLRRQLLAALEGDIKPDASFPDHLAKLAKDNAQAADECNARLALWQFKAERMDEALKLLQKINLPRIGDPALLAGLEAPLRQSPLYGPQLLAVLDRLTALDPASRDVWERWLAALAGGGDDAAAAGHPAAAGGRGENAADAGDPQTLAGPPERFPVAEICRRLADASPAELADTLPLLAAAERTARDDVQWLWIAWLRAYVLNRLDRRQARDEAIRGNWIASPRGWTRPTRGNLPSRAASKRPGPRRGCQASRRESPCPTG